MEDCRTLQLFLYQLVKVGKLKQFLHQLAAQGQQPTIGSQRHNVPWSSLGMFDVIFAAPRKDPNFVNGVMTIDNALKRILVIYLCGRYLLITMLNLYN